jgi:hypothetical protein
MTTGSAMPKPQTQERPYLQHSLPNQPAPGHTESYSARVADARRLAESCRVVFNMEKLRRNIESGVKGEHITSEDVHDWLEALGFTQSSDGIAWIGRRRTLRHFAEGEVVSYDSM